MKVIETFFTFSKVTFPDNESHEVFLLDDGIQSPVTFATNKKNLVVATFARFLLRNIGKSGYTR